MDLVSIGGLQETSIRGATRKIRGTAMEKCIGQTAVFIKETGSMELNKGLDKCSYQMVKSERVTLKKEFLNFKEQKKKSIVKFNPLKVIKKKKISKKRRKREE